MSKNHAQFFNEKQKINRLERSIHEDVEKLSQQVKVLRIAIEDVVVRERHSPELYPSQWWLRTGSFGVEPLEIFRDWDFNDRGLKQLGEVRKALIAFEKHLKSASKKAQSDKVESIRKLPKELQKSYTALQKLLEGARCEYKNLPRNPEYGVTGFAKKVCVGSWGYEALGVALKNPGWKVLGAAIKVDKGIVGAISQLLSNIVLRIAKISTKTVMPRLKKAFQRPLSDRLERHVTKDRRA